MPANSTKADVFRIAFVFFLVGMNLGRLFGSDSVVNSNFSTTNNDNNIPTAPAVHNDDPVHILYALSGEKDEFIDEFYVSLKSVMLNSPIDRGMTIHVLTDPQAFNAVRPMEEIMQFRSRQPISIQVYNVESKAFPWKKNIEYCTGHKTSKKHTMGTFFRLYAYEVLPASAEHAVYLDTDVMITTNLQELWRMRNSSNHFQWGETRCAGFMILNLRLMRQKFWKLLNHTYPKDIVINVMDKINDQDMVRRFNENYPHLVSFLPPEWDNHRADNFVKLRNNNLLTLRPKMGMVHFNGGTKVGVPQNVFLEDKRKEFTAAHYYAYHPWQWTGYMLESQLPDGQHGHPISLNFTIV
jgi:lipopolysaccharide biosynthesis glycosyltransferase